MKTNKRLAIVCVCNITRKTNLNTAKTSKQSIALQQQCQVLLDLEVFLKHQHLVDCSTGLVVN